MENVPARRSSSRLIFFCFFVFFVIPLCITVIYSAIDFIGTLEGWWVGNAASVFAATWFRDTFELIFVPIFSALATGLKFLFTEGFNLLLQSGLSRRTAILISYLVAIAINIVMIIFLVRLLLKKN